VTLKSALAWNCRQSQS